MRIALFSNKSQALSFQKQHANDPEWSFGSAAQEICSWIDGLWSLWGDGRFVASKTQRLFAFTRILEDHDELELPKTHGMASLLVRLADEVLGSQEFDEVLEGKRLVDARWRYFIEAVRLYEGLLASVGLVDRGRACELMASQRIPSQVDSIVVYDLEPTAAQKRLFHQFSKREVVYENEEPVIARAREGIEVRFAFPSGRYAEAFLIAEYCLEKLERGNVLITARHPLHLYEELAPALKRKGVVCSVSDRRLWRETHFGRAFLAVSALLSSHRVEHAWCSDYLLNPFSGVSSHEAFALDAAFRGNRLMDKDECVNAIRAASRSFEFFEGLLSCSDANASLGYFADYARVVCPDEACCAEEAKAVRALEGAMAAAEQMGVSMEVIATALGEARIAVDRTNERFGEAVVRIVDAFQVESEPEGEWETLIMCDMDNASFPAKQADNAVTAFAGELGIARQHQTLTRLRKAFVSGLARAKSSVLIERCLNDEAADPTYPAATVEEFVDTYRADPTDGDEIDNRYALPPCFFGSVLERGEEGLYENSSVERGGQGTAALISSPRLDSIESSSARDLLVLPRQFDGGALKEMCLSASQIENYLECPQKWFALRRLRLDDLDEGFGPAQMGEFSHGVFEDFYRTFQERVAAKVTPETLPQAQELMRSVIEEHYNAQFSLDPEENRLVPSDEFERREVEELARKLVGYLEREAEFLPTFHPYAFEFEIPASDPVPYAGRLLVGKIDRIDVDDRGRAVIVDYKGSLSPDYDLYEPKSKGGALREGKIQAIAYAQAVRRILGFEVVGALYVSYGRSEKVSGAIDASIEPLHVPGMRAEPCVYGKDFGESFHTLLDATEQRVSNALDRLARGCIEAHPTSSKVCGYCPEISCRSRKG